MKALRLIALALRTLGRNPLRSFFMMLGVTIGIASLTALTSVGKATTEKTMRQFKNMLGNFDLITIQPGAARTRGMPSLTSVEPTLRFEDAQAIATEAHTVAQVAPSQDAFDIDLSYRDNTTTSAVFGVASNWLRMRRFALESGSWISAEEEQSLARVAVIGKDIANTLFPGEDPVGKQFRIAGVPFQVKGVLASRGAGPAGTSLDNFLLIPVTTASKRLFNRDYLTQISVQIKDPQHPEAAVKEVTAILRERHGIVPPVQDDFTLRSPRVAAARVSTVRSTLSTVLTGAAVMATVIGGVVIMSLMLTAVSERRREIGMRRAVGATRRDVLVQFLAEAAVLSTVGGAVGIALGVGVANLLALQRDLPPAIMWPAVAAAAGLSVAVGLVFGLQPAWKAANVDPIEALRS